MSTTVDPTYAVLSAMAYENGRNNANLLRQIQPNGAVYVDDPSLEHFRDDVSGFEASAFSYNGKIVISYAGTLIDGFKSLPDVGADLILGFGGDSQQIKQAAEFYQRIKQRYGSNIVFTGHSLGGGLAALMGVFFDKEAITFDPAPFRLAATEGNAQIVSKYLEAKGFPLDTDLATYSTTETLLPFEIPNLIPAMFGAGLLRAEVAALWATRFYPTTIRGEEKITAVVMEGEILTAGYQEFGSSILNRLRIQSSSVPHFIENGGVGTLGISEGIELHSVTLLSAFAIKPELAALSKQLPAFVSLLFDKSLYAQPPKSRTTDILVNFLQKQYAATGSADILGKFAADLNKLVGSNGVAQANKITDALTVAAMEYYYFKSGSAADKLFIVTSNAISFKYSDIGASQYKSIFLLVNAIGATMSSQDTPYSGYLMYKNAWHIQTGAGNMISVGDNENDAAIGGLGADQLSGGAGDDFLYGGDGADQLTGGAGYDELIGGVGNDIYIFSSGDGHDTILDSDGVGQIQFNGAVLTGGTKIDVDANMWKSADGNFYYNLSDASDGTKILIINRKGSFDSITVKNFISGRLGITLSGNGPATSLSGATGNADYISNAGNIDGLAGNDALVGTAGNDNLFGNAGNDMLFGNEGDDTLKGGMGNDLIIAGDGIDVINGGDGDDIVLSGHYTSPTGDAGSWKNGFSNWTWSHLYSETIQFSPQATGDNLTALIKLDSTKLSNNTVNLMFSDSGFSTGSDNISGGAGNDLLNGGADNDFIDGGDDDDALFGNGGNDVILGGKGNDQAAGGKGDDIVIGGEGNDGLIGENGNDTLEGGIGNDELVGDVPYLSNGLPHPDTDFTKAGKDVLDGGEGNDTLWGGANADVLYGSAGNDSIVGDWWSMPGIYQGDDYIDGGEGNDSAQGYGGSDTLFGGADNDVLRGDAADPTLSFSNHGDDYLDGEEGDDNLSGDGGADQLFGGSGNDMLSGDASTSEVSADYHGKDYLDGEEGNDTLIGGGADDELFGGIGNDIMRGDDAGLPDARHGNDYLDGEEGDDQIAGDGGNDSLFGGTGNDLLFGDNNDTPFAIQGNDYLDGEAGSDRLWGYGGADTLYGGVGEDMLSGGDGDDITYGGSDNDGLSGDKGNDLLNGDAGNDSLYGGEGNDQLFGGSGDDQLYGEDGSDTLDGGVGNDYLDAGAGNDLYLFGRDSGLDSVSDTGQKGSSFDTLKLANDILPAAVSLYRDGIDLVLVLDHSNKQLKISRYFYNSSNANADYRIEQIVFADGTIWGATEIAAKTVAGTPSAMTGTTANNVFVVDSADDIVTEAASGGFDTIQSSVSYVMPVNVEKMVLTGEVNAKLWANDSNATNILVGNAGNNTFNGVTNFYSDSISIVSSPVIANADMYGGTGDDTYYVHSSRTASVHELANEGNDTVILRGDWTNYTLADNVENIIYAETLTPAILHSLYGNALDNTIYGANDGFSGRNYIDGGLGADTMTGGSGNDTYVVDNVGDVVVETAVYGDSIEKSLDTVVSSISYTLGDHLENLVLTGDAITGAGNSLNNILDGATNNVLYSVNNTANQLVGGLGDDRYLLGIGDTAIENAGEGNDTAVIQYGDVDTTYYLNNYANIENLEIGYVGASNIVGNDGDNKLAGNSLANTITGGGGNDWLIGVFSNDVFDGGAGNDFYDENTGIIGFDTQTSGSDTYLFGIGSGQDRILDNGFRYSGDETDTIQLGNGIDVNNLTFSRSSEDLTIGITGTTDQITVQKHFNSNEYNQRWYVVEQLRFADGQVLSYYDIDARLAANNQNVITENADVLFGTAANDTYAAGGGDDLIIGGLGNDSLQGQDGYDRLYGNAGNDSLDGGNDSDIIDGGHGSDTLFGGAGDDTIQGGAGNDLLQGQDGNDTLYGGAGDDTLSGGNGYAWLEGGEGNDTYLFGRGVGASIVDSAGTLDTVLVAADVSSSNILVTGSDNNYVLQIDGTNDGISLSTYDELTQSYVLAIEQVRFADGTIWDQATIKSKAGIYGYDDLSGSTSVDDILYGSDSNDRIFSRGGYDVVYGKGGNDYIDGGLGKDTLYGGTGDDTYVVENSGDVVSEKANEGIDTVNSSITYTLGTNVENLTLTGTTAINGTGNSLNNVIIGNAAANTLDGGTGADKLQGGAGNDIYKIDNTSDVVIENVNEGTDSVQASISYTLGANLENLTLTGTASINGTGNNLNNALIGNSGANVLDGGAGADNLQGGAGNDTYIIDNSGDVIVESASAGTDTVQSSITYTLGANLENLTLTGTAAINGTGNTLTNILIGNSGNNILDGGAGTDTMRGGIGNDTYIVDNTADVVTENAGEGADAIQSSVTYTLGANVENLILTGTAAINATGNTLDNILIGNSAVNTLTGGAGNDRLDGGVGADKLLGGAGNDTYVVDNSGDVITENANEGVDSVESTITYTLGAYLENLLLTGTTAINGTGNTFNNLLTGNGGNNTLNGGAGNDIMQGGSGTDTLMDTAGNNLFSGGIGNDTMTGGTGNEFYVGGVGNDMITTSTGKDVIAFNKGDGQDSIVASTGQDNTISLGGGIRYVDLLFSKNGNDLILNTGGADSIKLANWYAATANRSVATLQVIAEAIVGYSPTSTDPLLNRKVEEFNFDKLVNKFDTARAANSTITSWALSQALLDAHLSGSDTAAIGGDLAYQYGKNNSLSLVGSNGAQTSLSNAAFGNSAPQAFQTPAAMQDGVKLL